MPPTQSQFIDEIKQCSTWEDKYKKLISLGKNLPEFPEKFRNEKFKVKGCQSQVWLHAEQLNDGRIHFQGDSDAILVKGLIALLLNVFSGKTSKEILNTPIDFIKEIGLDQHLTPSRTNGLVAMIQQIRFYAQAFYLLEQNK